MYAGPLRGELRVPVEPERLGALIGAKGEVKRRIEEALNVRVRVDSANSEVRISPREGATVVNVLRARDVVRAISYGFSPERALRLLDESQVLDVIDLKEVCRSREDMVRIKGRIIGREGKARAMIEDLTGAYLSVYDRYVAIIGDYEQVRVAREAVLMLIQGRQHRTVYNFLRSECKRLRRRRYQLWEAGPK